MRRPVSSWSETDAGVDDGATATRAAATGRQHFVTRISGHTDVDSIVKILDGSTIKWEIFVDVSVNPAFSFDVDDIPITPGTACSGVVVGSTADCQVNLQGYTVP